MTPNLLFFPPVFFFILSFYFLLVWLFVYFYSALLIGLLWKLYYCLFWACAVRILWLWVSFVSELTGRFFLFQLFGANPRQPFELLVGLGTLHGASGVRVMSMAGFICICRIGLRLGFLFELPGPPRFGFLFVLAPPLLGGSGGSLSGGGGLCVGLLHCSFLISPQVVLFSLQTSGGFSFLGPATLGPFSVWFGLGLASARRAFCLAGRLLLGQEPIRKTEHS